MSSGGGTRGWLRDLAAALILFVIAFAFLWDVLVGGKVLLPVDDLFKDAPWRDFAAQFGIGAPHNHLIADMIIQNISWKGFAKEAVLHGSLPLWNPFLLAGVPFLAAGQYAVLYPLGVVFYLLPVASAYGWFTFLHVFLGGLFMFAFLRVIRLGRIGALAGAITFAFSAFLVVSFLWPMVLSTAVWLPLLLLFVELTIRGIGAENARDDSEPPRVSPWLWPILGAVVVALQFLAGHMEISFYVLFTAGFYAACRLGVALWHTRRKLRVAAAAFALLGMIGVGTGLAAVQIAPFSEAIGANFRSGFVTYDQVAGYALPKERVASFLVPDFFGNPAVHSFWDVLTGSMKPAAHVDSRGNQVDYIADWDRKNYVEGASYVGILPLLLAGVALCYRRNRYTLIFAAYAAWSLLLAFGSPLYRIFFYGIPGFDQLHTPFRWLFPFTASTAVLAGIGAGWLVEQRGEVRSLRRLARLVLAAGLVLALALLAAGAFQRRLLDSFGALIAGSERLRDAAGDVSILFSFEWRNVAVFTAFLVASGCVLLVAARSGSARNPMLRRILGLSLVWVIAADLFVFGYDFNTRSQPAALDFVPPSVAFLQNDKDLFRIASVGEADVLTPNTAMRFGLQDVRGYDTIIPRQFVDFWSLIEDPRGYLTYSKIHKLRDPASLRSPLFRLMNVKYVLSATPIDVPGYSLAYQGEVSIYRSDHYLPRAFAVGDRDGLQFAANREDALAALRRPEFDPERNLVVEDATAPRLAAASGQAAPHVDVVSYHADRVTVETSGLNDGYLVLTDSYFPGWQASVDGENVTIYLADGNFRAVYVPAGSHSVVFRYAPASFKGGLAISGVCLALVLLGLAYFLRPRGLLAGYGRAPIQRVAKNSLLPMSSSLLNKLITAGFAMVVLRLLGPDGAGKYTLAILVSGYFEIFTNFGLNALLTREVAKDPGSGKRYLGNTTAMRLLLWLVSVPLIAGLLLAWHAFGAMERDTAMAIVLLAVALVPSNISAGISSLFFAHERMEYPAAISIVTTLLTVAFGTVALLSGWGFVGLALVAVIVNVITMVIFLAMVTRLFWRPQLIAEPSSMRTMAGSALPLMLNNLLATLFFRIDGVLLQTMQGNRALGYYGTAYRFVDALNFIPSAFTFAIFPMLSRFAQDSGHALNRSFALAVKLMLIVSLPIAVGTAFLAEPIVLLFGGSAYLPDAAIALSVLIWFLPFSYVNSVTQYVLIAVNQQGYITRSFFIATAFNVVANFVLIPRYSYAGAALATILSEIVLLVPFLRGVWRYVGGIPLLALAVRPIFASSAMALGLWVLGSLNPLALIPIGAAIYVLVLLFLRTFDERDKALLRQVLQRASTEQQVPSPS